MLSAGDPATGYDDRGAGAPVVLLHPFPFDRRIWGGLADALAARHRVITVDARGFGDMPLAGRYAIADLADDVAALLDGLAIPRATLLGMSMGGYTALAFAARHPARLAGVVLADTRAAADTPEARAAREAAIGVIRRDGAAGYLAGSLDRLLSPGATAAARAHVRARAETRPDSLIAGLEALRDRPDRSRELGAMRCPALLVCGDADQVTPAAEMRQMAGAIPGARFVPIAGAGHLAHVEAPDAFARAVAPFLAAAATDTRSPS